MAKIIFEEISYGGKIEYLFDSDEWQWKVLMDTPEEALDFLNSLLRKGEDIVQSRIDLDDLFNEILIKRVDVIFGEA